MSNPYNNTDLLRFTPTARLQSLSDITLKPGKFPLLGSTGQLMLDRVVMDSLNGLFPVFFITGGRLPKSSVPHRLVALVEP